jgi:hypothetical protein
LDGIRSCLDTSPSHGTSQLASHRTSRRRVKAHTYDHSKLAPPTIHSPSSKICHPASRRSREARRRIHNPKKPVILSKKCFLNSKSHSQWNALFMLKEIRRLLNINN